ncbi:MAG TPA: DUF1684 domain-containing protein [Vicinamibacterales bacterium]|jgi:hypothetical protein
MIARTVLALTLAVAAVDPSAVAETEKFRATHEADFRRDFVTLAGLFSLKDGGNTIGSAISSDILLPKPAPERVGRLIVSADRVRFEPAPHVAVTIDDKAITEPVDLKSDEHGPADQLAVGGVTLWVHMSGDRRTVRMRDVNGVPAKTFEGFHWFPIDQKYRVTGRFIRDAAPRVIRSPNQLGDEETFTTEGIVEFTLDGHKVTLRPMMNKGRLWFIFRDGTSGKETYETARFLYGDLKPDGTVVVDFNQAYNPPCSFSPYTTCPLPLKENRMTVRILAGEKAYPHPPSHTSQ